MTEENLAYLGGYKTATDVSGYTKLWYTRNGRCGQAFIIKACPTGFLLCLPQGAIAEEELDQATLEEYTGVIGPWTTPSVIAVGVHGRELKKTLPVLIVDVQASEISNLSVEPVYGAERFTFGTVRLQSVWPARVRILEALEAFLNGEELPEERLEGYFTAASEMEGGLPTLDAPAAPVEVEEPVDGEVLHQLLQQSSTQANLLQSIQAKLSTLDHMEERLATLERQPEPAQSKAGPPAQGSGVPTWAPQLFNDGSQAKLGTDQIQQLLSLAGRGPRTLGDVGVAGNHREEGAAALGAVPKAKASLPLLPDLGRGGRRRARGRRGGDRSSRQAPCEADQDPRAAGIIQQAAGRPAAEPAGRQRFKRGRSESSRCTGNGSPPAPAEAVRISPRASGGEDQRATGPGQTQGDFGFGTSGYVPAFPRNCSSGLVQDSDLFLLSSGGVLGGGGERASSADGGPDWSGPGLCGAGRKRAGPHSAGMASDRAGRPTLCPGGTAEGSEVRSAARHVSGPSLGYSELGLSPGCRPDHRTDQQRAWPEHPQPTNESRRAAQRPWPKSTRQQGRGRGKHGLTSSAWFLPQVFPNSLDEALSASQLCTIISRFLPRCGTRLSNFICMSIAHPFSNSALHSSSELWPCRVPPALPIPRTHLRGRREARWRLRCVIRLVCRHVIAANNWLALNRPQSPPCDLPPPSTCQQAMVDRLESMASAWIRLGLGPKRGLDRSVQKFDSIKDGLTQLHIKSQILFSDLQPYSKPRRGDAVPAGHLHSEPREDLGRAGPVNNFKRIDPTRLKFDEPPSFEAKKFLTDPLLRAGLRDPRAFRKAEVDWAKPRVARVQACRNDQFELYRKWDGVDSLYLLPAEQSEYRYRCGLFAVYKGEQLDCQILNPIPENSRSFSISEATLSLAHSSLLCQLYIPENQVLCINSDDLSDFYHGFSVSELHAARNHIHGVFDGSLFTDFKAFRPELCGKPVIGCFRTLAMGTSFAVELAQHAHAVLLYRAGCLRCHERVGYKRILPKGPGFDLLCIDDHVYLLLVDRAVACKAPSPNRRDAQLFAQAAAMYSKVGLRVSAKKRVRNALQATVLGGEIDGLRGDIAAPRLRTVALGSLTFQLIVLGFCTKELLQCIIGCWVFVCMFRRPCMSILSQTYHELSGKAEGEIFRLSHDCRQELLLLTLLSPCMYTDLRAEPLGKVFCTDASGFAAGVCVSRISKTASLELLRRADHKGFHTRLQARSSVYNMEEFELLDPHLGFNASVPAQLSEGIIFDFMEIFRGEGNLTETARSMGLRTHPGFDIADGPSGDLSTRECMGLIIGLICRRVVAYVHLGPPCTTFGTMRRPRVRSKREPFGFDPSEPATCAGNLLAIHAAMILHLCSFYSVLASCEQPSGSVMFRLDIFRKLRLKGFFLLRFPFCGYGTPFQKDSAWLVSNPKLLVLQAKCCCPLRGRHLRLESCFTQESLKQFAQACRPNVVAVFGRAPRVGEPLCRFSGTYPVPLCRRIFEMQLPYIQKLNQDDSSHIRPAHQPPRWVADLGCCLSWKTLIQYRFKRVNHININEELSYRSLIKHVAKTKPSHRFGVMLDSRVVIGCSSKGRSSSAKLNFYLSSCLPYILGGNLYPAHFHVGTHDNAADDPSRLRRLRDPAEVCPVWLTRFLRGDHRYLAAVKLSDDFTGSTGNWARLSILLLILAQDASPPPGFEDTPLEGQS